MDIVYCSFFLSTAAQHLSSYLPIYLHPILHQQYDNDSKTLALDRGFAMRPRLPTAGRRLCWTVHGAPQQQQQQQQHAAVCQPQYKDYEEYEYSIQLDKSNGSNGSTIIIIIINELGCLFGK
jgi:hypothetical protein